MIFLFSLVSDEPEVFLPKYSQTTILHAAHFRWVVIVYFGIDQGHYHLLNKQQSMGSWKFVRL